MTAATRPWARELLYVWFHRLGPADWFGGSGSVDDMLRKRFGDLVAPMGMRPAAEFLNDRPTTRAAILLFDQIPRNLYRDTARAFAWDPLALDLARGALVRGWLAGLRREERQFVLMPLMHSEEVADQRLSLALFARHVTGSLPFARSHHRMIARFGRFPHRNEALGRQSSAAESAAVAAGFNW